MEYFPQTPPSDPKQMPMFLLAELQRIQQAFSAAQKTLTLLQTNVAPSKPKDGNLFYADGTNWNPGSGKGVYAYYGAAYHFLG